MSHDISVFISYLDMSKNTQKLIDKLTSDLRREFDIVKVTLSAQAIDEDISTLFKQINSQTLFLFLLNLSELRSVKEIVDLYAPHLDNRINYVVMGFSKGNEHSLVTNKDILQISIRKNIYDTVLGKLIDQLKLQSLQLVKKQLSAKSPDLEFLFSSFDDAVETLTDSTKNILNGKFTELDYERLLLLSLELFVMFSKNLVSRSHTVDDRKHIIESSRLIARLYHDIISFYMPYHVEESSWWLGNLPVAKTNDRDVAEYLLKIGAIKSIFEVFEEVSSDESSRVSKISKNVQNRQHKSSNPFSLAGLPTASEIVEAAS